MTSRQVRRYSLDIKMNTEVERLAAFVSSTRWEHLTPEAREALRLRVLDSLGCAIAALDSDVLRAVRAEVDELGGQPGLYSRRFLGEETTFGEKMDYILETLKDTPDERRGCRFNCAVAIATPDGKVFHCSGICEGRVAREKRGEFGFGYDPIFFFPELGETMAELPPNEKHLISHRGKALACAKEVLRDVFGK